MQIQSTTNTEQKIYVGKCKNNQVPKHALLGEKTKVTLVEGDKNTSVEIFHNPEKSQYVYFEYNGLWLWIKYEDNNMEGSKFKVIVPMRTEKRAESKPAPKPQPKPEPSTPAVTEFDKSKRYKLGDAELSGHTIVKKFGMKVVRQMLKDGKLIELS